MTRYEFRLPDIGEGVTEGEVVSWLVLPGQVVQEDEPMVEVMTDKATVTIASPKSGTILETRARVGETVQVHSVLVVFEIEGGEDAGAHQNGAEQDHGTNGNGAGRPKAENVASAVGDIREDLPGMSLGSRANQRDARIIPARGLEQAPRIRSAHEPAPIDYYNERP